MTGKLSNLMDPKKSPAQGRERGPRLNRVAKLTVGPGPDESTEVETKTPKTPKAKNSSCSHLPATPTPSLLRLSDISFLNRNLNGFGGS